MAVVAKKKPPSVDLAVIMGGPPKKPPMGEEPDGDEAEMAPEGEPSEGAFDVAYEEAMDESLSPEDRKAAFKRAVMACMEGDY